MEARGFIPWFSIDSSFLYYSYVHTRDSLVFLRDNELTNTSLTAKSPELNIRVAGPGKRAPDLHSHHPPPTKIGTCIGVALSFYTPSAYSTE